MRVSLQTRRCRSAGPGAERCRAGRRLSTGAAAQMASSPASMAALPGRSAIVRVGPPLSATGRVRITVDAGAGGIGIAEVPPPSMMEPAQLPPLGLSATIVLLTVTVPPLLKMPPPIAQGFCRRRRQWPIAEKVLLLTVSMPQCRCLRLELAQLPVKVLLLTVTMPELRIRCRRRGADCRRRCCCSRSVYRCCGCRRRSGAIAGEGAAGQGQCAV